jgi:hypothetical protein
VDLKNPNLDTAMEALESMVASVKERCAAYVEAAREDVRTAQRALQTIDGAGIVAAASNVWVRELDFTRIEERYQRVRARIEVNQWVGHNEGIASEERNSPSDPPIVKPGRYRAVLCLIPIKDEP